MRWLLLVTVALCSAAFADSAVELVRNGDRIDVSIGGEPFTAFHFGADLTKPFLHPLRAVDGTIVTRGYPMEEIGGEQRDHPHHRGAWFSHGEVNGIDFWANEVSQRSRNRKGVIALDVIQTVRSGPHEGLIEATFEWQDLDGAVLLREDRSMRFKRHGDDNIVDFELNLTAEADSVHFGDTKEGTFAVRIATELEEQHIRAKGIARTGKIVSAEGGTTEARVWGKRSPWVDYSGSIEDKPMGIAIFDHPSNPKHPTFWHVRGYGLFAANVFGEHHFYNDDSRDGSITLAKGESIRFRYRIVIHSGRTADAEIPAKFAAWKATGPQ